jgi:Flp pilus assembly protein TadG
MTHPFLFELAKFLRFQGGNAAVEFAILMPVLLLLVTSTVDLGLGFQEKIKLQSALNTGLQHAMQTQGSDIATTRTVIDYGLGNNSAAEIKTSTFCRNSATATSGSIACQPGASRFAEASVNMAYKTALFAVDMTLEAHFQIYVGPVQ